jgi:hypothetical protein
LHSVVRRNEKSLETVVDKRVNTTSTSCDNRKTSTAGFEGSDPETFVHRRLHVNVGRFKHAANAISIHASSECHRHCSGPTLSHTPLGAIANDGEVRTWSLLRNGAKNSQKCSKSFAGGQAHHGHNMERLIG